MKKLTPKRVNRIFILALITGALIIFLGLTVKTQSIQIAGVVVMGCAMVFKLLFYRCPYCGKYLDRSTGEYCPYCGEKVNEIYD